MSANRKEDAAETFLYGKSLGNGLYLFRSDALATSAGWDRHKRSGMATIIKGTLSVSAGSAYGE
jgi:hypothetical protein